MPNFRLLRDEVIQYLITNRQGRKKYFFWIRSYPATMVHFKNRFDSQKMDSLENRCLRDFFLIIAYRHKGLRDFTALETSFLSSNYFKTSNKLFKEVTSLLFHSRVSCLN